MADTSSGGATATPEITNKSSKPPGIIPKNAQTWAMAAIAIVMVSVIAFSGGPAPKPKTDTTSRANAVVDPNQRRIQDYRQEIAEQTRKLAEEQARLETAKRELDTVAVPGAMPNQAAMYPPPPYAANPAAQYNAQPQPPTTKSAIESEKERREYASLFASNVALSFRKDGAQGSNGTPGSEAAPVIPPQMLTPMTPPPLAATSPSHSSAGVEKPASDATEPAQNRPATKAEKGGDRGKLEPANGKKYRLYEGTVLETVLTNRLAGEFSGPVNCMVTTNVYSHDHQKLLIPQGSRALGEANKVTSFGQQRLAVFFHRIIMPDGYSVDLDDFQGLNQIGETGLRDHVNHHYAQIFGTSLAIGAIAGLAQANTQYGLNVSALDNYRQGVSESLSQSSLRILDKFLNVLPTFTIREGHRIKVYLSDDMLLPAYDQHQVREEQ